MSNSDPILRCAAGEALGRMAQVVNDPEFVARMAQRSFEKCQKTPDAMVRTGHALALGCLHRYVGGMESGQHLRNSVSILIALAKDQSSSLVQVFHYFFTYVVPVIIFNPHYYLLEMALQERLEKNFKIF